MNEKFSKLGFYPSDILLPKNVDMSKWAVVACDQFTSEPEYWQAVEKKVGDAPSTLRLILPESKLEGDNVDQEIKKIKGVGFFPPRPEDDDQFRPHDPFGEDNW